MSRQPQKDFDLAEKLGFGMPCKRFGVKLALCDGNSCLFPEQMSTMRLPQVYHSLPLLSLLKAVTIKKVFSILLRVRSGKRLFAKACKRTLSCPTTNTARLLRYNASH